MQKDETIKVLNEKNKRENSFKPCFEKDLPNNESKFTCQKFNCIHIKNKFSMTNKYHKQNHWKRLTRKKTFQFIY